MSRFKASNVEIASMAKQDRASAGLSLMGALREGITSPVIIAIGDSTGDATTEWVYKFCEKLKAQFPAYNVKYRLISSPSLEYGVATFVGGQTGSDRHILYNQAGYVYMMGHADVVLTSPDLDIRVCCDLDNWDDGATKTLMSKFQTVAEGRSWWLYATSGTVRFVWSEDGTATKAFNSSLNISAYTPGQKYWFRVTLDVDDGAGGYVVKVYTSADGVTWAEQDAETGVGTTSVYAAATIPYYLGAYGGSSSLSQGKFYHAEIRDGIDGPNVLPQPIEAWLRSGASPSAGDYAGTKNIYVFNASVSGWSVDSINVEATMRMVIPIVVSPLVLVSIGHNDQAQLGAAYLAKWDAVIGFIKADAIAPNICILTQNPKISPATKVFEQSIRRRLLMGVGAKHNLSVIDTFGAFLDDGRALTDLIAAADGVHPTAAGSIVQAEAVWRGLYVK